MNHMKRAFEIWMWSLAVVARSYGMQLALAVFVALWAFAAYAWLGLPESSGLLLILALVWAVLQLLAAVIVIAGSVSGAAEVAGAEGGKLPLGALWVKNRRTLSLALIMCVASFVLALLLEGAFNWINNHSVEVASFLTFHSEKPVSYVLIQQIYRVIEGLVRIVLSGFLLSFLMTLLRTGRGEARQPAWKLLAGCTFRIPFWTSLLSVAVFGGLAYELANWHPIVPAGLWDYTQVIVRWALVLILLAAGWSFWLLSLGRLLFPPASTTSPLEANEGLFL
jgi:hypothetical protein